MASKPSGLAQALIAKMKEAKSKSVPGREERLSAIAKELQTALSGDDAAAVAKTLRSFIEVSRD